MFKLTFKLTALTLVLLALATFLTGSKVHAASGCPSDSADFGTVQNNFHWGIDPTYNGTHGGNMAGMIMHATDASTNKNMDVNFTLHSGAYADDPHYEYVNGHKTNLNDRIFEDVNGNFSHRINKDPDGTGDYGLSIWNPNTKWIIACKGWQAYGPFDDTAASGGNSFVLDCGPQEKPSLFWFSDIKIPRGDNHYGQDGYWSIDIRNPWTGSNVHISHYREGSMYFTRTEANRNFTVSNGSNTFVSMVWHPEPPTNSAACSVIDWYNYGDYTTVNNAGVTIHHKTRTLVETTNPGAINNATGGSIYAYAPGSGGSTNKSDQIWHITATAGSFTFYTTRQYQQTNGNWAYIDNNGNPSSTPTRNGHLVSDCYHATCSNVPNEAAINVKGINTPGDIVVANQQYTVTVPIWNNNASGNAETIPESAGGFRFSLTEPPDDRQGGYAEHAVGKYLNVGSTTSISMTFTAPNTVRNMTLSFYPDLYGSGPIGEGCSITFPVYQNFSASLSASSDLKPTIEHPNQGDDYKTSITVKNDSGHAVSIPTSSAFYKLTAGPTRTNLATNNGGTYPASLAGTVTNTLNGHYDIAAGSYQAGDEYCATITATYTTGYVGPDNNVIFGGNPATSTSCPRITNEPYFKVYDGDISAGGDFDQCTTNGGTLAGYADISDPPGATRGSSTELSALALIKITGVASAKTPANITSPPAKLSFANSGVAVDSTGNESPTLGGQFGGCRTLTGASAPASAKNIGSSSTPAVPLAGAGAYTHSGNLTISGGALGANQNVSIFVDGDAYISGNISYGNNWQAGTAPSFVLHATGNIYIDPSATQLAGVYIAHNKSDGTAGKIYTCASTTNHFSPMPVTNLYDGCKNQLIITGNFVARQVNLMRTFGSLRDEEPNAGQAEKPAVPGTGYGLKWYSAGSIAGMKCTRITETSDPDTWDDNYLCVPSGSDLQLAWTHSSASTSSCRGGRSVDRGDASLDCLKSQGYQYCVQWDVPADYSGTWYDNYLCSNKNVGFSFGTTKYPTDTHECTLITEGADPNGQWKSGYWLCEPLVGGSAGSPGTPPTAKGPPFTACSNKGSQLDTISCAGELFEYGPTLFLSNPAVNPPAGGALQFQSITSLPPVL